MDIDSPSPDFISITARDCIVQRLVKLGVPQEDHFQLSLVAYAKQNKSRIQELVSAILPNKKDELEAIYRTKSDSKKSDDLTYLKDLLSESMVWLQWLMFEGDPEIALSFLARNSNGERGVCGTIWGSHEIAYRCRTCEGDPTCAICVPCFQNGTHKDHDYSIIYTGGGCCDCGDVTAWKLEGFCSNHKGAEKIQALPDKFADSMGPVIDALFNCWKDTLLFKEAVFYENYEEDHDLDFREGGNEMTIVIVEMLLEFCKQSESLLCFISGKVFSVSGLLDILVKAERFLNGDVTKKLHELLLKFIGEPVFKNEFAKVFLNYYPIVLGEAIKACSDAIFNNYPLLSTFAVQIFTVPTLTPRLVKEMNLLGMLLGCLENIFLSCAGEDGLLQVNKWSHLYDTTFRVAEDIRFVMGHEEVPKYVTCDQQDILNTWMRLLAFVQGMDPMKRITDVHVEEEFDNMHLPFVLDLSIANIHGHLTNVVFSVSNADVADSDHRDGRRQAKVGWLSQEDSVCIATGKNLTHNFVVSNQLPVHSSVLLLIVECLKAIDHWLRVDNTYETPLHVVSPKISSVSGRKRNDFLALKKTFSKIGKGKSFFNKPTSSTEDLDNILMDEEHDMELDAFQNWTKKVPLLGMVNWPDIEYDVSSQDISVHIPLHRLLALLLQKTLKQCFEESVTSNVTGCDFFKHALGECHPCGFSGFIMEHPLRIRVFCAEVHAGMWRRNGDAPIISSEWYRLRWPEQGLELDLFLLQCCAALAPADLFVNRVLQRFGLLDYLSLNVERSSEYEPVLLHEMLILLIQVIKERRFCGLTTAENLKRELIYKLVTGDATHSQIVKSLPQDLSKSKEVQEILENIAEYSQPSSVKQGMYSLRSTFWKELDLYHPRWNPKDLQVAEERYLRFCNASALTTQLPKWSKIWHPLNGVAKISTCKSTLQIIRAVLFYAVFTDDSSTSRVSEGVLITTLHLFSLALDICSLPIKFSDSIPMLDLAVEDIGGEVSKMVGGQSLLSLLVLLMRLHKKEEPGSFTEAGNCDISSFIGSLLKKFVELDRGCMLILQKLAPEVVDELSKSVTDGDGCGSASDKKKRKDKARERQAAIMAKMKAEQVKFLENVDTSADDVTKGSNSGEDAHYSNNEQELEDHAQEICSLCHDHNSKNPVSFLIFLQKSRLKSFVDEGPPSWDKAPTLRSNKQVPIPESTSETAPPFNFSELVENTVNKFTYNSQPKKEVRAYLKTVELRFPSVWNNRQLSTSNDVSDVTVYSYKTLEDILFSEIQQEISNSTPVSELFTDCSRSLFAKESLEKQETELSFHEMCTASTTVLSQMESSLSSENDPSHFDGIHLSSCGHAVHQGCLDRYLTSLRERYNRRLTFEGSHIVVIEEGEFLCPVCRRLVNSILSTYPRESFQNIEMQPISSSLTQKSLRSYASHPILVRKALALLQSASNTVGKCEVLQVLRVHKTRKIKRNLEPVLGLLFRMYFPEKKSMFDRSIANVSHSSALWDTLRYSIISTEIATRTDRTSMTPTYTLDSLYNEHKESGGFILSLLLKIVQSNRHKDPNQVLQRFSALQLFTASICSGISIDTFIWSKSERGENKVGISEHAEGDIPSPDYQFLNRASSPILALDPFSSLMWTLFCLPRPFLCCEESFLSLVHIFYIVSVAQAIITYFAKFQCDSKELGFQDCMISDISKVMNSVPHGFFESNYIDPSCSMINLIQSLSFPYLRRCVLLSKLVRDLTLAPFCDGVQISKRSSYAVIDDTMEFICSNTAHLEEVEKLESMFKIPSLDIILKDEMLRSLALKWLNHFCFEFESRNIRSILYSTPAVPFTLMHLPDLYQDILQRYNKQCCLDCKTVLDDPALCLLCGRLCSPNWKFCCSNNECQPHAMECGAGIGVFLLIKRTTILLQRSDRQAPWPSLYLDAHGEEDVEMRRGRPLFLNKERYAALNYLVASHGLDRSSKILRQTTLGFPFVV